MGMVQGRLGVKVSYTIAWRGKKQVASDVWGSPEASYMMLPSYLHILEMMNSGTVTRLEVDVEQKFRYLFFALGACIECFKAMRKVIIVDEIHPKNAHGGVLIVASAQDLERYHYPITFGIVDAKKYAIWRWFLNTLKTVVPDDPELYLFLKEMQTLVKSCVNGANKEFIAMKFRECVQVYTVIEFITLYDDFRKKYPTAAEYLDESVDESRWAECYFLGEMYNMDTTNCAESINVVFKEARKYSLLPMLDVIVKKIAEWFNKHRKNSS